MTPAEYIEHVNSIERSLHLLYLLMAAFTYVLWGLIFVSVSRISNVLDARWAKGVAWKQSVCGMLFAIAWPIAAPVCFYLSFKLPKEDP